MDWMKYNGKNFKFINESGVVYVIDFGDYIKIGSTKNLNKRYKQIYANANYYHDTEIVDCYYTVHHERYKDTEQFLHKLFYDKRKPNTELFNMSIKYFLFKTKDININTEKIDRSRCNNFIESLKEFIGSKNESIDETSSNVDDLFRHTYCSFCTNNEFNEIMDIINMMNRYHDDELYFNYLLYKMAKIMYASQERHLKQLICKPIK